MKITVIELDANGAGVDFWKHASYRIKIDGEIKGTNIPAYDMFQIIEDEVIARSYRPPNSRAV